MQKTKPAITIRQLAQATGVSVCTVNKALTGKPRISAQTRQKVMRAAERLGYHANPLARALSRRTLTLGVVYPKAWPRFYEPLVDGIRQRMKTLQDFNVTLSAHSVDGFSLGESAIASLQPLIKSRLDGLVACPGDATSDQLLWSFLKENQVPFVLLGNDIPDVPRLSTVRLDAKRCGRMVAELLGMITGRSPCALLVGNRALLDHREKIEGFSWEAAHFGIPVAGIAETHDDPAKAYPAIEQLLAEHPEVSGIYIATDNYEGVCRYLVEKGLVGKIKVIATGVFPEMKGLLNSGVVQAAVYQNMARQGQIALEILYQYLTDQPTVPGEILVEPRLVLRNNVDLWT